MRESLSHISIVLTMLLSSTLAHGADRPNIIIVLTDDMGYSDIGCYGGEIDTPNLDTLASNGLRYTQFYNSARCCPTRASLLTGLHPHQTGIGHMTNDRGVPGYRGDLSANSVTIAEVLGNSGYSTYMSGKWHVTKHVDGPKHNWPIQRGFDEFYGTIHGAGSFYDPVTLTRNNTRLESPEGDYYYTDAITDQAVEFIQQHSAKKSDEPFFMYVAYTAPHWPLHAPADVIEKYKGRFDQGWDTLREERMHRMKKMGLLDQDWSLSNRDKSVPEWDSAENKEWEVRRMEVYAAQIDIMDQGIGDILSALKKTGTYENTLILFLADNGGCAEELQPNWKGGLHIPEKTRDGTPIQLGNDPKVMPGPEVTYQSYGVPWANVSNTPFRRYKHWVHEGGIATPLIAHWPGKIKATGELRRQPGHIIDLMATCVDAAGATYPKKKDNGEKVPAMEGLSLLPTFGEGKLPDRLLYWEHEGNRAIRDGNWKLVAMGQEGPWELYNLSKDRTEVSNLAQKHPKRVEQMSVLWDEWAMRAQVLPRGK